MWPRPTSAEGDVATDALISAGFSRRASARASRCELCQARYPATFREADERTVTEFASVSFELC